MKHHLTLALFLACSPFSILSAGEGLTVSGTDGLLFNANSQIGSADFTLGSLRPIGFGGMYVNSPDENTGKPFYGYAVGGLISAYHFFDAEAQTWTLNTGEADRLKVGADGAFEMQARSWNLDIGDTPISLTGSINVGTDRHISINSETNTSIGSSDLVLNGRGNGFVGMYVNSSDADAGKPFYGYAINGVGNVFHYWDAIDDLWKLYHTNYSILEASNEELIVNGSLRVADKTGAKPAGTIYYANGHFYGITNGGVIRQLDNETSATLAPNASILKVAGQPNDLEKENDALREKVADLEARLENLEKLMIRNE